jgi:diacyltrehalose acyltransferase
MTMTTTEHRCFFHRRQKARHVQKMSSWTKRFVPAIAATSLLLASGTVVDVESRAEEAILIPGATILKPINPFYSAIAMYYPTIGINFHDDANPHLIDYSQDALNSDKALADGVKQARIALRQTDGKVVIIGESMGAMVAARVAIELAAGPDAPSTDDVRVILIAPPEAGVAEYFRAGTFIPILNYRVKRVAWSPYPTTIVIGEYDGWADPPDRPWNLLASANALMGIVYVHGFPIAATDPDDVPPGNVTTIPGTTEHGPITTLLVPTRNLPLTQLFRDLGVPDELVDEVDAVLRPVIDSAYVRHDQPGDTRPYLHNGAIRRTVGSEQVQLPANEVADALDGDVGPVDTTDAVSGDVEATRSDTKDSDARDGDNSELKENRREMRLEQRNEQRQAIRNGVTDLQNRIDTSLNDLKKRIKGPQAKKGRPAKETTATSESTASEQSGVEQSASEQSSE